MLKQSFALPSPGPALTGAWRRPQQGLTIWAAGCTTQARSLISSDVLADTQDFGGSGFNHSLGAHSHPGEPEGLTASEAEKYPGMPLIPLGPRSPPPGLQFRPGEAWNLPPITNDYAWEDT